jgi:pilus assembly protein FimV
MPWYKRWIAWVIGLLVLMAIGFGWYRSRRGEVALEEAFAEPDGGAVRGIKDEAEEILKVLEPADQPSHADQDEGPTEEEEAGDSAKPAPRLGQSRHFDHEEAQVLDEESADPEVRLDLARAYISMGDREAARAILGEVIEHGDEAQKAEAEKMLSGL